MPEIASAKLSIDPGLLPDPEARVLDVGCGDGRHLAAAAKRGCVAIGLDYERAELSGARARTRSLGVDLIVGDATRLPFRDGCMDAVICTETLEHLPDDAGAMREIARVLRHGGLLHGAVPSHFTELVFWRLSRRYYHTPGGHVRIYSPYRLFEKLKRAGLRVTYRRYVHFFDSLFWLRFCLLDLARPARPRSDFEAAVIIAEALERPVPTWRTRLRAAFASSRFIALLDTAGALIWPKSLMFVARKTRAARADHETATMVVDSIH